MTVLEDPDYADNIGLLSNKHNTKLYVLAKQLGLKVSTKKAQVVRKNTRVNDTVMIDGIHLEDIEDFTYLGTKVTTAENCSQQINTRISKAKFLPC